MLLKQESEAIPPPVRGKIDKAISDMNGLAPRAANQPSRACASERAVPLSERA